MDSLRSRTGWRLGLAALLFPLLLGHALAAESATRRFDLPAGPAGETLKQFSSQAGVQVLFPTDLVQGVRTNAVRGDFPPNRALEAMVRGTELVAFHDERTGALGIKRASDPNGGRAAPATATGPRPNQNPSAAVPPPSDVPIELSPFVVTSEDDDTWLATNTLAGSRLNTPLRDTGASISVLTSEFLKDLGAIDLEDAVGYAVNVHMFTNEGTNVNDNWSMGNFDVQRIRVRGVDATVTRNYFRWGLQSDAYNADRIEENRGPNSILFGIGSAGGVLNTLTKRANLNRSFRRGSVIIGSYGSHRGTFDINQRLLAGRLAFRVNAVYSEQGAYRDHAFNDTQRVHLASTWQIRDRSRLRLDYEIGAVQNLGARPVPAYDGTNTWENAGSQTFATIQTANLGPLGISRYAANARRITVVENLGTTFDYQGFNRSTGNSDVILDQSRVSFKANPVGPFNRRDANFQALTMFWEEKLFDHTFVELSHNVQIPNRRTFQNGQGRTENATLYADPHRNLPTGAPNPFAGAYFFEGGRWNKSVNRQKSHNTRLMVSHEMEFGKWGNYRLAGMGEYEWRKEENGIWVEVWEGSPFNTATPENDANHVWRRQYVVPGVSSTYHAGMGPIENRMLQGIADPTTPGRLLNSVWVPFNQNQLQSYENQTTFLIGGHARYFKNRLVLGAGYREDDLKIRLRQAGRGPVSRMWEIDPTAPFNEENYSGNTRTLGAVGHVTQNLSLFYNFSNSINIPNTSHRILPDGRIPPAAEAKGEDFGIGLSFFDGKLSGRVNRFAVDMIGSTGGGFGGTADNPTVLNNRVLTALVAAGAITQAEADQRDFTTNQATIDRKLEGYEVSLTGAITRNWRLQVGYSYTDGFDSNIGPEVKTWAAEALPWYRQWPNVVTGVTGGAAGFMTVAELVAMWEDDVRRLRWIREGDLILGNRKHKYSFFTRYSFERGPLKGLYLGGGYRYHGKAPLGFDNDEKLLWGKSQGEADGMIGYRLRGRRLFLRDGLSLQLNVKNLLNDTDPRITTLRGDGVRVSRALIVEPRSWRLTASMEF